MKNLLVCALVLVALLNSGCVYDAAYCRYSGESETGYDQKKFQDESWGVEFVGGYPDFCKEAAFYRAAELTWEKGHRYFKVLEKEDRSRNEQTSGAHTTGLGGQVAGSSVYVPVYYYRIRFLNGKEDGPKVVDAYHVLNTHNYPRKAAPYTVAERQKDHAAPKQ